MSIELFTQVYKMGFEYFPKNPPTVKSVLLALADCASPSKENSGYECWPSVATISKKTLLTERTIYRSLTELEGLGYIKRINRIDKKNGRSQSNLYQLCLPAVVLEATCHGERVTLCQGGDDTGSGRRLSQSHTNPNIEPKENIDIYKGNFFESKPDLIASDPASSDIDGSFKRFFEAYPRKAKPEVALKSFIKNNCHKFLEIILKDIEWRKSNDPTWKEVKFIPYPATYLNNKRWEEIKEEKKATSIYDTNFF